jgi:esterase/lipase
MIEILEFYFEFFNDQRSDECSVKKKREFVKNLEKIQNKCFNNVIAQMKSFIATIINIILNLKKFVFEVDTII